MELKFDTFQQAFNSFANDKVKVCGPGPIIQRDDWGVATVKNEGKLIMLQVYVVDPSLRYSPRPCRNQLSQGTAKSLSN
jgi:hypothetical protein